MALRCRRFLGLRAASRFLLRRPLSSHIPHPLSRSPDLLLHPSDSRSPPFPAISERFVIEELVDLLDLEPNASDHPRDAPPDPSEDPPDRAVTDRLISPIEKLRGVFLQRLAGRFQVESALSDTGVDLTPEIFAGVVNRGNLGGAAIVSFFDWAIKQRGLPHCVGTYNTVIKALGRRKFFDFVEEMLLRMKKEGVELDCSTVAIVLDCYVAARRVRRAVEVFERLEDFGGSRDCASLCALLHSLCRWSHVKLAQSFMNKVRGKIRLDNAVHNEIIGGWAKLGRVDETEGALQAMIDDGLSPDSRSYGHVICALGRAGRKNDALVFFEEMGCTPDIVTYGAIVAAFLQVGDLDKGIELYKKMVEQDCVPDNELYTKLICALLKVRRVADALEVFEEMLSKGVLPSTGMITSFIQPLCSYGPPYAAMLIYKKAKKLGCEISLKAHKLLLLRLSKLGKCGTVLMIWQEMQESGHQSDVEVYECIVEGLCNVGQLDSAVLVVEESLRNGFCIGGVAYSKLSNKLLERNKVETAYKLLLKIRKARQSANMQKIWRYKGWHF